MVTLDVPAPGRVPRSPRSGPRSFWRCWTRCWRSSGTRVIHPCSEHQFPRSTVASSNRWSCRMVPFTAVSAVRRTMPGSGQRTSTTSPTRTTPPLATSAYTPRNRSVRWASRGSGRDRGSSPGWGRVGTTHRMVGTQMRKVVVPTHVAADPCRFGKVLGWLGYLDQDVGPESPHIVGGVHPATARTNCDAEHVHRGQVDESSWGVANRASVSTCLVVNTEVSGSASDWPTTRSRDGPCRRRRCLATA